MISNFNSKKRLYKTGYLIFIILNVRSRTFKTVNEGCCFNRMKFTVKRKGVKNMRINKYIEDKLGKDLSQKMYHGAMVAAIIVWINILLTVV